METGDAGVGMTDPAIIAASYAAERNYSHNPDDVIDPSGAIGAWGTAKESTTELVDLSGNGNIADIHGAMPTDGFIQGRRFTAANSNHLNCGDGSLNMGTSDLTIEVLVLIKELPNHSSIISKRATTGASHEGYGIFSYDQKLYAQLSNGTAESGGSSGVVTLSFDTWHRIVAVFDRDSNVCLYIDGVEEQSTPISNFNGEDISTTTNFYTGRNYNSYVTGIFAQTDIYNSIKSETDIKQDFNAIARLPFWSVNYTDYPDNVTEYTNNLPYSSSIISSGTFKVDGDKLQCISAGTITYSASYEFDGSEYIKVEIGGVEYAGTGTITQGNTTVSVAQGSNKVTIQAGTGDTIDKVDIQFRNEV
jgi:hypothetical protein